jgi:hypothetical protein
VEFFGRCRKCRTQASDHPPRGGGKS